MYKGVSYPPSTPKKLYRKVRKTLLVDSRDRNPVHTQSRYSVALPKEYENVYSVTLRSAEIPISWYTFSSYAGNTSFIASYNGGAETTITIPDGNYTGATLATTIQQALLAAFGGSGFAVTYSSTTNKLTFDANQNFLFHFDEHVQTAASCGTAVPVTPTTSWWGLGYFMGFTRTLHASTSTVLTSDFIVQLNTENYIIMELDFINKEDETALDNRLSGRVDGCFAKIPLTGNTGDIIFFREWCCPMNKSILNPPLGKLKSLSVKFRHHDGRLVQFNNVDHSFTLEFELLDTNFDEYSSLDFASL
jgi:hypothetical protein